MVQINPLLFYALTGCVASLSAYLAAKQGRNPYLWFLIGFFFGLIGIAAIFFIPKIRTVEKQETKAPVTESFIAGPVDKFWYYLDEAHKQLGPVSYIALNKAWKEGKVKPITLVWNEELTEWKALQDCIQTRVVR